jgi:H+/Na+-translocating ferredoxin:NAD+ oxidoreductase subunit C
MGTREHGILNRKTFSMGGVHPPESKGATEALAIETPPLPKTVFIPLQQHIGAPANALVKKKDEVLTGQLIGEAVGMVSAPVHASVSGVVKNVAAVPTGYGPRSMAIEITVSEEQAWAEGILQEPDEAFRLDDLEPKALLAALKSAGLVGMGGAAFPTHVKLSPPPGVSIDHLILNGAECEPYLTADHRLMVERADDVVRGADVLRRILGVELVHVGVEDNKPDALAAFAEAQGRAPWLRIHPLKTQYPQGAEKQLIRAITGREVPSGKLPLHVGVVVQNVGTAFAAFEAVFLNKPLIERVTTISGSAVANPKNLALRIGTPVADAVAFCGGATESLSKLILGGPMMGKAVRSLDMPVMKGTSGVLLLSEGESPELEEDDCIRCAMCVQACPQGLTPCDLANFIEYDTGDKALVSRAADMGLNECVECGSCNYICPTRRRLVQWIRLGKALHREVKK